MLTGDALSSLDFLSNGTTIEFGSDAAFISAPEPSTLALVAFALVGLIVCGWRRRR
jgi:hypothetical protein